MNPISRHVWAPETQSIYDRILPFSHFECPPLKLTNKTSQRNYRKQVQNNIPFKITQFTVPFL